MLPLSLIQPPQTGDGFTWRSRLLPGSSSARDLTLAVDVHGGVAWAPRGDRRAIRDRALRLCIQLTESAFSEGFLAQLLPARPCDDPPEKSWICVARLRLTQRAGPGPMACPANDVPAAQSYPNPGAH